MTKKEIEDGIWSNKEINTIGKVEAQNAIDMMQDDFESRLCENCICFKTPQYKSSFCEKINHVVPKDFGCNKFEKAQK